MKRQKISPQTVLAFTIMNSFDLLYIQKLQIAELKFNLIIVGLSF